LGNRRASPLSVPFCRLPGSYTVEAKQGALHGSGVLTVVQGAETPSRVALVLGP